jgi:hypothetical protein
VLLLEEKGLKSNTSHDLSKEKEKREKRKEKKKRKRKRRRKKRRTKRCKKIGPKKKERNEERGAAPVPTIVQVAVSLRHSSFSGDMVDFSIVTEFSEAERYERSLPFT